MTAKLAMTYQRVPLSNEPTSLCIKEAKKAFKLGCRIS